MYELKTTWFERKNVLIAIMAKRNVKRWAWTLKWSDFSESSWLWAAWSQTNPIIILYYPKFSYHFFQELSPAHPLTWQNLHSKNNWTRCMTIFTSKQKKLQSLWPVVRNKFKKWTERYKLGVKAKTIKWEGETPLRRKQPLKYYKYIIIYN